MVMATEVFSAVMTNTPRKLKIAAITMAERTPMARVDTQVAMALGASVQPFTRITAMVSSAATISEGFASACWMNASILMPMYHSPILYFVLTRI